jgi:hypothetical protein
MSRASLADAGRTLSSGWKRWIAENLLLGVPVDQVVAVLRDETHLDQDVAWNIVQRTSSAPLFTVASATVQSLQKLESLLDIQQSLRGLDPSSGQVPRRRGLGRTQFLKQFYSLNHPVIIEDFGMSWPALERWSPEYFRERFGDEQVEVMLGREADDRYEMNSESHKTRMAFRDYVDMLTAAPKSNDFYLVANNHLLELQGMLPLLDDIVIHPTYLRTEDTKGHIFFWFGPGGTITPLHHDLQNIIFVQVYGTKRITLISPFQSHLVYNKDSVYSEVDVAKPDYERFPRFAQATPLKQIVHPGEALFIPVGWWHRVEALEVSVSVSFTNFVFPNSYEWRLPSFVSE